MKSTVVCLRCSLRISEHRWDGERARWVCPDGQVSSGARVQKLPDPQFDPRVDYPERFSDGPF